mmetsp:Transcript_2638/g.2956  ORF Transcript_2638/g.2956 Transcript_2638/m.2956 type:complete len:227 (-) Transcript_2638:3381-4061(-)
MCNPHPKIGASHVFEPDAWVILLHTKHRPAAFKPAGAIVDQPWLLLIRENRTSFVCPWYPSQKSHQLAPVADSKAECICSLVEVFKLFLDSFIESDSSSPSLGAVQHICIAESSGEHNPSESVQSSSAGLEVRHCDVMYLHARHVKCYAHLSVSVGSLLAHNCHFDGGCRGHDSLRRRCWGVWDIPLRSAACCQPSFLLSHGYLGGLLPLKFKAGGLPDISQSDDV